MVYIFIFIALIALAIKGYCGKKVSGHVRNMGDSFLMNTVRFILCLVIGLILVLIESAPLRIDGVMLAICALSGIASAVNIGCWVLAVKSNALATVDVSCTLASILPAILCWILFGEAISGMKMIGFAFIAAASFFMLGYNKTLNRKGGILGKILLILTALGDALVSFSQQLYKQYRAEYSKTVFNFYIYIFAAIALAVFFLVYALTSKDRTTLSVPSLAKNTWKAFPFIGIMAICLFAANFLQTAAAFSMPPQILYPIIKGGCLVGMLIVGAVFFGEKFNKKSIIGTSLALVGIVLINIL